MGRQELGAALAIFMLAGMHVHRAHTNSQMLSKIGSLQDEVAALTRHLKGNGGAGFSETKGASPVESTAPAVPHNSGRNLLSSDAAAGIRTTTVTSTQVETPHLCAAAISVNGTNLVNFLNIEFKEMRDYLLLLVGSLTKNPTMAPSPAPTLMPIPVPTQEPTSLSTSCKELLQQDPATPSGVYNIRIGSTVVQTYCEMDDEGGGWTLLAKTIKTGLTTVEKSVLRESFWDTYANTGYGSPEDSSRVFWMPLERWSELTAGGGEMWQKVDTSSTVQLTGFKVANAAAKYAQSWTGTASGHLGGIDRLNGMKFTARDNDNDESSHNCATDNHGMAGGWWYENCYQLSMFHPNGNCYRFDANVATSVSYIYIYFR